MVSKELFMSAVTKIRRCYNDESFLKNRETLMEWYKEFEDCNEWSFKKAVAKCVSECSRIPVVADIKNRYEEIQREHKHQAAEFSMLWDRICGCFPNGYEYRRDKECTDKIKRMTVDKFDGDYGKAYWLGEKVYDEVKSYADNHDPLPDFKKYFMGVAE